MKYLIVLLLVGCAGHTEETPEEPLHCKSSIVGEPDARRLLIECNRPVEAPLPWYCEDQGEGAYLCTIYHASDDDCAMFPGICDPQ